MFKLLLVAICLSSCIIYSEPVYHPSNYGYGTVNICDESGCREIPNVKYFIGPDGFTYYYDMKLDIWIGVRGYFSNGRFYKKHYNK